MSVSKKFLGVGWAFPVRFDKQQGHISISEYEENIKESIRLILETDKGERVMRPDFGCGIRNFVFESVNAAAIGQMESTILEALKKWEPRINVLGVDVSSDNIDSGKLVINIQYVVIKTNNQFNMVYPFYIMEGTTEGT